MIVRLVRLGVVHSVNERRPCQGGKGAVYCGRMEAVEKKDEGKR